MRAENQLILAELEILWSDFEENDVDAKLKAFDRLKAASSKANLSLILHALQSDRSDFWIRELLSEPIVELGGIKYLPQLFEALEKNFREGHDNDTFLHNLTELALFNKQSCKKALLSLLATSDFEHKTHAEWLLQFCE